MKQELKEYDLAIIGSGVAGMSAGIYALRYEMSTIIFGDEFGGTIAKTHLVENYPGFSSISGMDLGNNVQKHLEEVGGKVNFEKIERVERQGSEFLLNDKYSVKSIIIATGTKSRKLDAKNILNLENKGVSYCATCDGPLFKDKVVGVVGGSDSAAKEALLLSKYAQKVYIFYRKSEIRAEPINKKRVQNEKKIEIVTNVNIKECPGEKALEKVILDNGKVINVQGLFIEIGRMPHNEIAKSLGVNLNEKGEILVDSNMKTNVEAVFAAGDVCEGHFKQAIVSAAQGSLAAESAFRYAEDFLILAEKK